MVVPQESARVFRSDGAYMITGGLGGLGLFLGGEDGRRGLRSDRAHLSLRSQIRRRRPQSSASAPPEPTSWWSAVTSQPATPRDRLVEAATATGLSAARSAACRGGGRGRHAEQHHR